MDTFVKLSDLVDDKFTIVKVHPFVYKMWDAANRKMLVSDDWQQGYRKIYPVETDRGKLDLGSGQLGSILEAAFFNGKADLNNITVAVKSNGKTGMEVRYFFNVVKNPNAVPEGEPVELESDPFEGMDFNE